MKAIFVLFDSLMRSAVGCYGPHCWGGCFIFHMIPVLTLVGPWYIAFRELGWYDTLAALVVTHVTLNLPITVW